MRNIGMFSILRNSDLPIEIGRQLCRDAAFANAICGNVLLAFGGFGSAQLNTVSSETRGLLFVELLWLILVTTDLKGALQHSTILNA
jgi:hypothetical protein